MNKEVAILLLRELMPLIAVVLFLLATAVFSSSLCDKINHIVAGTEPTKWEKRKYSIALLAIAILMFILTVKRCFL